MENRLFYCQCKNLRLFLGNLIQEKLGQIYASCDAFIFPSVSETYGNVVLEAMSSGLACIIANGGGSKSFIDHGVNGFLCEPFDADEYLQHIENLMIDHSMRSDVINNGLDYVQGFDWDTLVESFYDQLNALSKTRFIQSIY